MTSPRTSNGLSAVLPLLACPHCVIGAGAGAAAGPAATGLELVDQATAGCRNGHRFDIARQGYLSLLGSRARTDTADSADMVAARMAFLSAGHYAPIALAVADLSGDGPAVEIGAGTGYYLAAVLDRLATRASGAADPGAAPQAPPIRGLALDSSRFAARRAALAHPGIGSVVADAWSRLPVLDAVAATVLSVFAPRDPAEVSRVLAPDGRLVVVTPEPDHLLELRSGLGMLSVDAGKPERLALAFQDLLAVVERRSVRATLSLSRPDVSALVRMGPSARHLHPAELASSIDRLDEHTTVTLSVTVSVLARGSSSPARPKPLTPAPGGTSTQS